MTLKYNFAIWLMGCISGLGIVITSATLNFWLAKEQVSNAEIGLFSLVALPYCINFIWSPILDRFKLPILGEIFGHRLGWVFLLQMTLGGAIFLLSLSSPLVNLMQVAFLAVIIAFISSTNDNLLNAIRSEILPINAQGFASGIYIFGYRIGMLLGTSGAIYLSIYLSWEKIYKIIAICFLIFPILLTILLSNKANKDFRPTQLDLTNRFKNILNPIGPISFIFSILVLLVLYRIADNFINTMINPFLLSLSFNEAEIATTGKLCGSIGSIIGGLLGGYLMRKLHIVQSLWYFGLIHTSSHVLLAIQAIIGKNLAFFFITSISESITGGMAMAAYIAFISSICKGQYKTTQQALFSSMMGLSRSIFPSISGFIASQYGWLNFFMITFLLSIPGLVLLYSMKKKLTDYL
jgi:PAT family beta-lactamase induction signal transducer AmpG